MTSETAVVWHLRRLTARSGLEPNSESRDEAGQPSCAPGAGTWSGHVEGTDGFIAIVSDSRQLIAYACDNGTIGAWFFGAAGTCSLLRNAAGDTLSLQSEAENIIGTLTLEAEAYRFKASATDQTSLYRADATTDRARAVAGWIHLADEVRGSIVLPQGPAPVESPPEVFERMLPIPRKIDGAFVGLLFPTPITPDTIGAQACW